MPSTISTLCYVPIMKMLSIYSIIVNIAVTHLNSGKYSLHTQIEVNLKSIENLFDEFSHKYTNVENYFCNGNNQ